MQLELVLNFREYGQNIHYEHDGVDWIETCYELVSYTEVRYTAEGVLSNDYINIEGVRMCFTYSYLVVEVD